MCTAAAALMLFCVLMVSDQFVPMGDDSRSDSFRTMNTACAVADTVTIAQSKRIAPHPVVALHADTIAGARWVWVTTPLVAAAVDPPHLEFPPLRT